MDKIIFLNPNKEITIEGDPSKIMMAFHKPTITDKNGNTREATDEEAIEMLQKMIEIKVEPK